MLRVRHEIVNGTSPLISEYGQVMLQLMLARLSLGQHARSQHAYVTHQHPSTDVIRMAPLFENTRQYQCHTREWDTPVVK